MALDLRRLRDERGPLVRSLTEAESVVRRLEAALRDSEGADQISVRLQLTTARNTVTAIRETLADLSTKEAALEAEAARQRAIDEEITNQCWEEYSQLAKELPALAQEIAAKRRRCSELAVRIWGAGVRRAPDPVLITIGPKADVERQSDVKIKWERQ